MSEIAEIDSSNSVIITTEQFLFLYLKKDLLPQVEKLCNIISKKSDEFSEINILKNNIMNESSSLEDLEQYEKELSHIANVVKEKI